MKSQDEALIETTRDIESLGELLDYCSDINVCRVSAEFWKASLTRLFGNILVLQRGDLETAEEWHEFALNLVEGRSYKYCLRNDVAEETWEETPRPLHSLPKKAYDEIIDELFDIPAVVPAEGTRGYFVRLYFDATIFSEEITSFFCHSNLKVAKDRAAKFAGENVHRVVQQYLAFSHGQKIRLAMDYDSLRGAREIKLPLPKYFVDGALANDSANWFVVLTHGEQLVQIRMNIVPITF